MKTVASTPDSMSSHRGLPISAVGMAVVLACAPYADWLRPRGWSLSVVEILLICVGLGSARALWRFRAELFSGTGRAWLVFLVMAAMSSFHAIMRAHPYLDRTLAEQLLARWTGRIGFDQIEPLYTTRAWLTLLVGALAFGLGRYAGRDQAWGRRAANAALLGVVVAAGWAVAQRILEWDLPKHWMVNEPQLKRVGGPFGDPNLLGSALCLTLPLMWVRARDRAWWWLALAIGVCGLVLTWSRAALGAMALVGLFVALDGRRRPGRFALSILVLSAGVLLVAWASTRSGATGIVAAFLAKSASIFDWDRILLGRQNYWRAGLEMVSDFPLLGSGPGTTFGRVQLYGFTAPENLHDYFLQIAAETGLVGLVAFGALLLGSLGFGRQPEDEAVWTAPSGVHAGAVAFLLTCLTGHPLLDPRMQILFWGVVGALGRPSARRIAAPASGSGSSPIARARPSFTRLVTLALVGLGIGGTFASVRIGRESVGQLGLYEMPSVIPLMPLAEAVWPERTDRWWWTDKQCRMRIPRVSDMLALTVQAWTPDIADRPLPIELYLAGELRLQTELSRPGQHRLFLRLHPSESADALVDLGLRVGRTWSPARAGLGADERELGVALQKPVWYAYRTPPGLPNGFYPAEHDEAGRRFHWTADLAQARIRCASGASGSLSLSALVAHPDVEARRLRVRLDVDANFALEQRISAAGWVTLKVPDVRDGSGLSVEISRTWRPPGDPRDLGLRIAVPDVPLASGECGLEVPASGGVPLPPRRPARVTDLERGLLPEPEPLQ